MMGRTFDVVTATLGSVTRHGLGVYAQGHRREPAERLELYDMEGCSYCRKVREALTTLDLDVLIHPCPKGGQRFRPRLRELGGKEQFPYLVDPNTGRQMYESNDIVDYLFATYGHGRAPIGMRFTLSSHLVTGLRLRHGLRVEPSRAPEEPLLLYTFESSPFCRLVREWLTTHEIAYVARNVGKGEAVDALPGLRELFAPGTPAGTERRRLFVARSGKMQVPYLVDPNTGQELFESQRILEYLEGEYG